MLTALVHIGTGKTLEHAMRQSRSVDQFRRHMNTGFDAFKTLKLVHRLRDLCYPSMSLADLGAEPAFARILESSPDLAERYRQLVESGVSAKV